MALGDYGLAIGAATEGFRQQEQDVMKKESFGMKKDKYKIDMDIAKKTLAKEGYREAVQMIVSGDIPGAEASFNKTGNDRVQPGSTKFDHKTGLVTWKDANGEDQVADIRFMAAMANIRLPKRKEGQSSSDYYRKLSYGLKAGRYGLAKKRLKLSIQKEMKGRVVSLFGGFYDPVTGKIRGLSKTAHKLMAGIMKRVEQLQTKNPKLDPQDYVNQAAREAGIKDIPEVGDSVSASDIKPWEKIKHNPGTGERIVLRDGKWLKIAP